jgi:hypothetical protein
MITSILVLALQFVTPLTGVSTENVSAYAFGPNCTVCKETITVVQTAGLEDKIATGFAILRASDGDGLTAVQFRDSVIVMTARGYRAGTLVIGGDYGDGPVGWIEYVSADDVLMFSDAIWEY